MDLFNTKLLIDLIAYLRSSSGSVCASDIIDSQHIISIVIIHAVIVSSWGKELVALMSAFPYVVDGSWLCI